MADWESASLLACLLAEPYRDRKRRSRPYTPADFDPHAANRSGAAEEPIRRVGMEELGAILGLNPRKG